MGKRSTKRSKSGRRPAGNAAKRPGRPPPSQRVSQLGSWALILAFVTLPALVVAPSARESFRLPKLFAYETLGLLSLLLLTWRLRSAPRLDLRRLLRRPVVAAVLPLLLVAAGGLATSDHPLHVRQALASLLIGAACLVGWSLALRAEELRRVLFALLAPAMLLSLLAIAQFHGWIELFKLQGRVLDRIAVTSLAGGVFDLAGLLVLPLLVAQAGLWRERRRRRRWLWGAALTVGLYAMILTQTLTAIAALVAGSFVLWLGLLPWRRVVAATALVAVIGVGLGWGVQPLRQRLERKIGSLEAGNVNRLLSGRLDAWWAARWMFEQHPWAGVGHGAFRAEFGDARLALWDAGRQFYRRQHQTYFSNAHSEVLEVAAEWGVPGCLALAWAFACLLLRLRSRRSTAGAVDPEESAEPRETALMAAGVVAMAALAAANFPWRIALVAYPQLIFLSWIFASRRPAAGGAGDPWARRLVWVLVPLLAAGLVLEVREAQRRLLASQQLAAVEDLTRQLAAQGMLAPRALERNAGLMRQAAALDPVEVGIPIARGAQYLLLKRYPAAIRAYEEALELEARGEIYANLGKARYHAGDREGAREAFIKALRLNHTLARRFRAYVRELGVQAGGQETAEEGETEEG